MPSKNSINRPKRKNIAHAKAHHKARVAKRVHQTDIIYGKVESKKVQQKKLRAARLQAAAAKTAQSQQDGDVEMEMVDAEEETEPQRTDKIDTKKKKEARIARLKAEKEAQDAEQADLKEYKMDTSTGKGTTLGGPPQ